jgi:hypothetical protein
MLNFSLGVHRRGQEKLNEILISSIPVHGSRLSYLRSFVDYGWVDYGWIFIRSVRNL